MKTTPLLVTLLFVIVCTSPCEAAAKQPKRHAHKHHYHPKAHHLKIDANYHAERNDTTPLSTNVVLWKGINNPQTKQDVVKLNDELRLVGYSIPNSVQNAYTTATQEAVADVQNKYGLFGEGYRAGPLTAMAINREVEIKTTKHTSFFQRFSPLAFFEKLRKNSIRITHYTQKEKKCDYDTAKKRSSTGPLLRYPSPGKAGSMAANELCREGDVVLFEDYDKAFLNHDHGSAVDLMTASRGQAQVMDLFYPREIFGRVKILPYTGMTAYRKLPPPVKEEMFVLKNWKTGTFVLPPKLAKYSHLFHG